MPLLGVLTGGLDFSSLTIKLASDEAIQAAQDVENPVTSIEDAVGEIESEASSEVAVG